ncbi:hypothetical protein E3P81_01164 [Wallemia ichthyophaga]|nr:hypothetical protein E3P97_01165 [Wallemia ichthyophaga]TIB05638.1 hypothetical protein E3P96_01055 [Wallemia ichthyophaga]TIB34473.1 hypothetical protein E3P85_00914 [Wallemia ichthyophaga]TIB48747.1 hypothetical protein E3P82_01163 [Wallemia ichthyophaga]TIB52730.1 hypothetical protein E3P81_01164 [Wallemia ichthyophaga]
MDADDDEILIDSSAELEFGERISPSHRNPSTPTPPHKKLNITAELESTMILRDLEQLEAEDEDLDKTNSFDFYAELGEFDKHLSKLRQSKNYLKRRELQREADRFQSAEYESKQPSNRFTKSRKRKVSNDQGDRRYSYMRGPPTPRRLADKSWIDGLSGHDDQSAHDDKDENKKSDGKDLHGENDELDDLLQDYTFDNRLRHLPEQPTNNQHHSPPSPTENDSIINTNADMSSKSANEPFPQIKQESSLPDVIDKDYHQAPSSQQPQQNSSTFQFSPNSNQLHSTSGKSHNFNLDVDRGNNHDKSHDTSDNISHDISHINNQDTRANHSNLNATILPHVDNVLSPNNEAIVEIYSEDPAVAAHATKVLQLPNRNIETGEHPQLFYAKKMQKAENEIEMSMPHVFGGGDKQSMHDQTLEHEQSHAHSQAQLQLHTDNHSHSLSRQSTEIFSPQLSTLPPAPDFTKRLSSVWGRENWKALERTFNRCKKDAVNDVETVVSEFLDEWGVSRKRAIGDLNPDKIFNRVRALEIKQVDRQRRRMTRRSQSQSRGTSRATFSPSESLMNANYSMPPNYTPIYPKNILRSHSTLATHSALSNTPMTTLTEQRTPSSLQKIMHFGLNPLKGLFRENRLEAVEENDRTLSRSASGSFSDHSANSSISTNTGASIWREDKHKSRGIPPRRLHDNEAMTGVVRSRSTSLSSFQHNVRSMQGGENRQSDNTTHENKRRRQSPRRLSNTSQRSSSLRNDVTDTLLS